MAPRQLKGGGRAAGVGPVRAAIHVVSTGSMAFTDAGGDLHAVSIHVPTPRFDQQRAVVTKALLQLRADLPRVLGS